MSTTSNDVLLQAYTHIKADDPAPARALLGKYLRNNPNSERGWLLLSLRLARMQSDLAGQQPMKTT